MIRESIVKHCKSGSGTSHCGFDELVRSITAENLVRAQVAHRMCSVESYCYSKWNKRMSSEIGTKIEDDNMVFIPALWQVDGEKCRFLCDEMLRESIRNGVLMKKFEKKRKWNELKVKYKELHSEWWKKMEKKRSKTISKKEKDRDRFILMATRGDELLAFNNNNATSNSRPRNSRVSTRGSVTNVPSIPLPAHVSLPNSALGFGGNTLSFNLPTLESLFMYSNSSNAAALNSGHHNGLHSDSELISSSSDYDSLIPKSILDEVDSILYEIESYGGTPHGLERWKDTVAEIPTQDIEYQPVVGSYLMSDALSEHYSSRCVNPWSLEEKEMFLTQWILYGKQFIKIANCLEHKSVQDVIRFYFQNKLKMNLKSMAKDASNNSSGYQLASTTSAYKRKMLNSNSMQVSKKIKMLALKGYSADSARKYYVRPQMKLVNAVVLSAERVRGVGPESMYGTYFDMKSAMEDSKWSLEELRRFIHGLSVYGKAFGVISNRCVKSKSSVECKSFYKQYETRLGLSAFVRANTQSIAGVPSSAAELMNSNSVISGSSLATTPKKMKWSEEEEGQLAQLVDEFGQQWGMIASQMQGRTSTQVRAHWEALVAMESLVSSEKRRRNT